MRKVIFLFAILAGFASGCSSFNSSVNLVQNSNVNELEKIPGETLIDRSGQTIIPDYKIDSGCKDLLLEVVSGRFGMVYPQGKVLDFRIMRNGRAEFDRYEDTNRLRRTSRQISPTQVDRLVKLFDSKNVKSSKSEYVTGSPCLDATFEKTMRFCPVTDGQMREILIKECRPLDSSEGEEVPPQILNLTNYIDELKN